MILDRLALQLVDDRRAGMLPGMAKPVASAVICCGKLNALSVETVTPNGRTRCQARPLRWCGPDESEHPCCRDAKRPHGTRHFLPTTRAAMTYISPCVQVAHAIKIRKNGQGSPIGGRRPAGRGRHPPRRGRSGHARQLDATRRIVDGLSRRDRQERYRESLERRRSFRGHQGVGRQLRTRRTAATGEGERTRVHDAADRWKRSLRDSGAERRSQTTQALQRQRSGQASRTGAPRRPRDAFAQGKQRTGTSGLAVVHDACTYRGRADP